VALSEIDLWLERKVTSKKHAVRNNKGASKLNNRYEVEQQQAISDCKAGRYIEAERALERILNMMKNLGAPVNSTQTMYWYLVAKHKGDEKKATREFIMLED
jgi:hypothetical protein